MSATHVLPEYGVIHVKGALTPKEQHALLKDVAPLLPANASAAGTPNFHVSNLPSSDASQRRSTAGDDDTKKYSAGTRPEFHRLGDRLFAAASAKNGLDDAPRERRRRQSSGPSVG